MTKLIGILSLATSLALLIQSASSVPVEKGEKAAPFSLEEPMFKKLVGTSNTIVFKGQIIFFGIVGKGLGWKNPVQSGGIGVKVESDEGVDEQDRSSDYVEGYECDDYLKFLGDVEDTGVGFSIDDKHVGSDKRMVDVVKLKDIKNGSDDSIKDDSNVKDEEAKDVKDRK
ncbi:hypothetical protein G6F56_012666 [Rhizopus delemar]|nr:hypothetical protein G6F56_012666 [Rhizopus delemar]